MPMRPLQAGWLRSQAMVSAPSAGFVAEGIETALGAAAAADVLNDDVIAVAGEPHGVRIDDRRGDVATVGLAHEERGPRANGRRVVVVGDERGSIGEAATDVAFKANTVSAIDEIRASFRHRQAPCLGWNWNMATRISAMRAAASLDHFSPFSAVAGEGSPMTPLGAMSRVSHAKFAEEPSGLRSSRRSTRAM